MRADVARAHGVVRRHSPGERVDRGDSSADRLTGASGAVGNGRDADDCVRASALVLWTLRGMRASARIAAIGALLSAAVLTRPDALVAAVVVLCVAGAVASEGAPCVAGAAGAVDDRARRRRPPRVWLALRRRRFCATAYYLKLGGVPLTTRLVRGADTLSDELVARADRRARPRGDRRWRRRDARAACWRRSSERSCLLGVGGRRLVGRLRLRQPLRSRRRAPRGGAAGGVRLGAARRGARRRRRRRRRRVGRRQRLARIGSFTARDFNETRRARWTTRAMQIRDATDESARVGVCTWARRATVLRRPADGVDRARQVQSGYRAVANVTGAVAIGGHGQRWNARHTASVRLRPTWRVATRGGAASARRRCRGARASGAHG